MSQEPLFQMLEISKGFPGVKALDKVSFDCKAGEVHALVGENGAGKSTLMKVLSGVYQADSGQIIFDDHPIRFTHPMQSLAHGISVIYQEFSLLEDRTVAENIFLGREPMRNLFVDREKMRSATRDILTLFGQAHGFNEDTMVSELDVAQQQMVEITKALAFDAKLIVMDEPTAALNETECEALFQLIIKLREQGRAIVYITHRMHEIQRLADRVTVIKDGKNAESFDHVPSPNDIVEAMVGRELTQFYPQRPEGDFGGDVILSVAGGNRDQLKDINFELRAGEITGFAGIQGAGRNALALAMFGSEPFVSGTISINGEVCNIKSPRDAANAGIAMLPGDRKGEGLFLMQSVRDNGLIAARNLSGRFGNNNVTKFGHSTNIDTAFDQFELKAASYDTEIGSLSGGNQQKAIVARWLMLDPKVLIFIEPTRGIDVQTKANIYGHMRRMANEGAAIMMISSDLPEVLGVSDRVLVMCEGEIVAQFPHGVSEADVMLAATGQSTQGAVA